MKNKYPHIAMVEKEYGEKEAKIMLSYLYTYYKVFYPYRGKIPEDIFNFHVHHHVQDLCKDMGEDNKSTVLLFSIFYFNDAELIKEMSECGDEFLLPEFSKTDEFIKKMIEENLKKFIIE